MIFTNAEPGESDCAFIEENDGTQEEIVALVRKGYLVRTRTDADTKEGEPAARRGAMRLSQAERNYSARIIRRQNRQSGQDTP